MRRLIFWLALGWIAGAAIFVREVAAQQYKEGDIIGSYRGVSVYSNGGNLNTFYQCTKYVQNFFADEKVAGVTITGWGNATDFFGNGPKYNFVAYPQNSQTPPLPNEILCFGGGWSNYGHVAIITEVNESAGYIKIIDENRNCNNPYGKLKLTKRNGTYTIGEFIEPKAYGFSVQGWLELGVGMFSVLVQSCTLNHNALWFKV